MSSERAQVRWFAINAASYLLGLGQNTRLWLLSSNFSIHERLRWYLEWRLEQRTIKETRSRVLYSDEISHDLLDSLKSSIFIPNMDFGITVINSGGPI